jgi:hypothetical protein
MMLSLNAQDALPSTMSAVTAGHGVSGRAVASRAKDAVR